MLRVITVCRLDGTAEAFFTVLALAERQRAQFTKLPTIAAGVSFTAIGAGPSPMKFPSRRGGNEYERLKRQKWLPHMDTDAVREIYQSSKCKVYRVVGQPFVFKCTAHLDLFERERQAYAALDGSPFVSAPYEYGKYGNEHYFLLPYLGEVEIFGPVDLVKYSLSLLEAVADLHVRKVSHLDLKPEHIRISWEDSRLKIMDFDNAVPFSDISPYPARSGTRGFTAPEISIGRAVGSGPDVFSCGRIISKWQSGVRFGNADLEKSFSSLVERLLSVVPQHRPSPRQAVEVLADLMEQAILL